jgi:peroxiredoxin
LYYLSLLLLLAPAGMPAADELPGYQQSLDQYMEKAAKEKSPFSSGDMAVMEKAGKDLASSMPDPGIKLGEKAPDFVLNNALGKPVSLKDKLKQGPVVLVFYRGAWCPFCNMHLHVLQESLPEFKQYGAQLITITPQTPDKSIEQFRQKGYPFEVLIPDGLPVRGVVLADQVKSLDWRARQAEQMCTLPPDVTAEVLAKLGVLLEQ